MAADAAAAAAAAAVRRGDALHASRWAEGGGRGGERGECALGCGGDLVQSLVARLQARELWPQAQ